MKSETAITIAVTSPSARLPVTARNRALLRWLRAAELSAWEEAAAHPRRFMRRRAHPAALQCCVA